MGNLLFSPQGRISSAEFMRGGFILVLAAIALGLLHLINPTIAMVLGFLNILLMYAWAALWIKRLHDGGKSGWMFFAYIALYTIISMVALSIMLMMIGGEEFMQIVLDRANETMTDTQMQASMEAWQLKFMLPMIITKSLASLLTLYIGDKSIPTDSGDNKYGSGLS